MQKSSRAAATLATLLLCVGPTFAQSPLPTPQPVTSAVRQRLRTAILDIAKKEEPAWSNNRPALALPLAQLGDWHGALRLLRDDMNAPQHSDGLWHWRAYQLARAGKWREVPGAAAHITQPAVHADALLFAARQSLDKGAMLDAATPSGFGLKALLLAASPVLDRSNQPVLLGYSAYLWSRGGDREAARRVAARAIEMMRRNEAREKSKPKNDPRRMWRADTLWDRRAVLQMMGHAGLLAEVLKEAEAQDEFLIGGLLQSAHTTKDFDSIIGFVEKLPPARRAQPLFDIAAVFALRGDAAQARTWYERARTTAAEVPNAKSSQRRGTRIMQALLMAGILGDAEMLAQARAEVADFVKQEKSFDKYVKPTDIDAIPIIYELQRPRLPRVKDSMPSSAKLAEMFGKLQAIPASDLKFRCLEIIAGFYSYQKRTELLLPVAREMHATALALAADDTAERAKSKGMLNAYWPRSPRELTAIFWLNSAGETQESARLARSFAAKVPQRERPAAAMALFQLGEPQLADSVFDPRVEIARSDARQRANWAKKSVDWSEFSNWGEFAANEARFRSPDAPFRWFGALANDDRKANVLQTWIAALYPSPGQATPYYTFTTTGSRGSY